MVVARGIDADEETASCAIVSQTDRQAYRSDVTCAAARKKSLGVSHLAHAASALLIPTRRLPLRS
jgi:hypothetical protein